MYTIFVRDKIDPKIVTIQVQNPPLWIEPVEATYVPGTGEPGEILTPAVPGHYSDEITYHPEDQLNPGTPPVYPATFGRCIWRPKNPDLYVDDPKLRSELWEDTAGTASWADIQAAFPELAGFMAAAARAWGQQQSEAIASPYQENERLTWPYQRAEALAWRSDNAVSTPFCDGLAAARSVPRELFMTKVLENVDAFSAASVTIFGKQQGLLDKISGASTLDEIIAAADAMGLALLDWSRQQGGLRI